MVLDYKQFDPRWKNVEYAGKTIGISGCAPTVCADLIGVYPDVTAKWLNENDCTEEGFGTLWSGVPRVLKAYGIDSVQLNDTTLYGVQDSEAFEEFKRHIREGYCGILVMGKGYWTSEGHFIAVVGYSDEKYYIFDPNSVERTGWHTWTDLEGQIKVCINVFKELNK